MSLDTCKSSRTATAVTRRAAALLLFAVASFAAPIASAYEKDIHFSATLAIAIAEGWSPADARIIASADQGLDENKATIAALEFDVLSSMPKVEYGEPYFVRGPIHQAEKNFRLHCFSPDKDTLSVVEPRVRHTVGDHVNGFYKALQNDAKTAKSPPDWVDTLVALGVALHCQQDSQSHNNYGGLCPKGGKDHYPGNCYGHTLDSAKHRHRAPFRKASNPDHPAVRHEGDLFGALDATRGILVMARGKVPPYHSPTSGVSGPVLKADDLKRLVQLLHDPSTLKMSDTDRMQCNHDVIAAWLHEVLASSKSGPSPVPLDKNPVSKRCAAAFPSLFPKSDRMLLPSPSYPQLTVKAEARRASAGPYLTVDATGAADLKVEDISHELRDCNDSGCTYSFKVRISNTSQARSAAGYLLLGVVPIDDKHPGFGIKIPLNELDAGAKAEIPANTKGPDASEYVVYADIQPNPKTAPEWRDLNVRNDSGTCLFSEGKIVEKDVEPSKEDGSGDDGPSCRYLKK